MPADSAIGIDQPALAGHPQAPVCAFCASGLFESIRFI
jgi:hypothetical protein